MNELFERELQNTSINNVSLADYIKENYVPKKSGKWLEKEDDWEVRFYCCRCGKLAYRRTDYCPDCGARMYEPQESEDSE